MSLWMLKLMLRLMLLLELPERSASSHLKKTLDRHLIGSYRLEVLERFSIECRTSQAANENKVNTHNRPQARENASDQVDIGFKFCI